jgi:hypothetical protein
MNTRIQLWIAGGILIIAGLVLARLVAGLYADQPVKQLAIYFVGVILALGGLVIVLIGVRKERK